MAWRLSPGAERFGWCAATLMLWTVCASATTDRLGDRQSDPPRFVTAAVVANQPMGEPKGIFPGRVVWVHAPEAVNQACTADAPDRAWYLRENNRQPTIDLMVSTALHRLTGEPTDAAAWGAIFRFHNASRGKGAVGYHRGEKIVLKLNATSAYHGNFDPVTLTPRAFISETSVGPVLAVLRQLVYVVGVAQQDIYVGDPMKHIYPHLYDVWHGEFPDVHYLDNGGHENLGRETAAASSTATIYYSDRGSVLRTNVWSSSYPGDNPVTADRVYAIFDEAEYLINLPMLKGHKRAGVTMFAKNHFGSHTRGDASHLHNGLVAPTEMPNVTRDGYRLYRVQVDFMGHSLLGRKNLVYLMDALWASDHELGVPLRWQMPPFDYGYMASIFASLDPVAIESVGYDFLRGEFTAERVPLAGTYVQMAGVDDYLHQAADAANWPPGLRYDPDNTGTPLSSLGVHEHWDSAATRRYSRNLSTAGAGIELVSERLRLGGRLTNLSTRAHCDADARVAIGGLVVASAPKRVLIRAVGPSLAAQGLPTSALLADPAITLHDTARDNVVVAANDNWTDDAATIASVSATLGAAAFVGTDTTSAALLVTLPPGAFTAVVQGRNGSTGIVLVEIYDADGGAGWLSNLSTRAWCGADDNVTIGGFVIEEAPKQVLIRALGPTLSSRGLSVAEVLADPAITLHRSGPANEVIATNDDASEDIDPAAIGRVATGVGAGGLDPADGASSALLRTLPPGIYTVIARGQANTSGIVLVEMFDGD